MIDILKLFNLTEMNCDDSCLLNLSSLLFIERNYKSLNLSSLLFIERKWRLCNKDKPIYLLHLSQQNVVALSRMQRFMIKYSMSQLPSLSRVGYWDTF